MNKHGSDLYKKQRELAAVQSTTFKELCDTRTELENIKKENEQLKNKFIEKDDTIKNLSKEITDMKPKFANL
jgi:uncharacterized coiled-coil DUF342 family protein